MEAEDGKKESGDPTKKKFIMIRSLGRGAFGKVKEAKHTTTDMLVAIKILDKNKIAQKKDEGRVAKEIKILRSTHHENIIQLYEVVFT